MNEPVIPGHPSSGIDEASDDHRRTRLIAELVDHFPQAATPQRSMQYIKDLRPYRLAIRDVREGIKRVIATREQATFPPFAVLLRCCQEARAARVRVECAEVDESAQPLQRRDCSAAGIAQQIADFEMFRKEARMPKGVGGRSLRLDVKPMSEETSAELRRLAAERDHKRELGATEISLDDVPF